MHMCSLERFDFDSVLFPYNHSLLQSDAYRADVEALRELCEERNVAMQTIKSIARGRWAEPEQPHVSWYEPLTDAAAIGRAVQYVLGHDDLFLNTSSDARLLPALIGAADGDLAVPSDAAMDADAAAFDITPLFDNGVLERI